MGVHRAASPQTVSVQLVQGPASKHGRPLAGWLVGCLGMWQQSGRSMAAVQLIKLITAHAGCGGQLPRERQFTRCGSGAILVQVSVHVLDFSLRVPGLLVRELLKASFLFFHRLHKNYIIINYLIYRRHVRSRRQRGRFALATPTPGRASVFFLEAGSLIIN